LFKRQLAAQGSAPVGVSLEKAFAAYGEYLQVNRRKGTARRYLRVLKTLNTFVRDFHPGIQLLRDIRTHHLEDYKRKRFAGEIADTKSEEEIERELTLRKELESRTTKTPEDNGRFGWLGRWSVHTQVTQKTINYELQCIHTFLQWAIKQNYLFSNPAVAVEKFRLPRKTIPRFMTSEELTKFFAACNPEQRRIFSTMLLTGMRKGELKNLTWNDVNFQLGIIFIQVKVRMESED
jgi:integrase